MCELCEALSLDDHSFVSAIDKVLSAMRTQANALERALHILTVADPALAAEFNRIFFYTEALSESAAEVTANLLDCSMNRARLAIWIRAQRLTRQKECAAIQRRFINASKRDCDNDKPV